VDEIEKGDLYLIRFRGEGHMLQGDHYAVVVSIGDYNRLSTLLMVPFSSSAAPADWRPETKINGTRTRALPEQVRAVDRNMLASRARLGSLLDEPIMDEIDEALHDLLGLWDADYFGQ